MIVLVSLIVLLRELLIPLFFTLCIPTSAFIQLNDFCTCIIIVIYMQWTSLSFILASYPGHFLQGRKKQPGLRKVKSPEEVYILSNILRLSFVYILVLSL